MEFSQQYITLLYSKYSLNCKKLFELKSSLPTHIIPMIHDVCIDNDKVRNRIMKSQKIKITVVPCLLIIYPTGVVEKYDGTFAFEWINNVIDNYKNNISNDEQFRPSYDNNNNQRVDPLVATQKVLKSSPTRSKAKMKSPSQSTSSRKVQGVTHLRVEDIDDDESIRSEIGDTVSSETFTAQGGGEVMGTTSMIEEEDIEEDVEFDEREDETNVRKPVRAIRTDAGNYEIETDFSLDVNDLPARDVKRGIKSAGNGNKKNQSDILTAALGMQKMRDRDDEEMHPNANKMQTSTKV
jgi:hypothetical protein